MVLACRRAFTWQWTAYPGVATAILVVLVSIAQVSTAQVRSNALIPRQEIFGNPDRASPLISPDGRRIAFLAPLNGVMNIHVAERGKLSGAKAVTNERVRPVRSFSWAFNNTHILYKQDESGNENYNLFAVDLAHGKTVNLTPFRGARAALIAASPAIPDDILVGLNDRDPKWHDVWRINIISGKRTLVERNEGFAEYLADKTLVLRTALKATPDGGFQTYGRAGQAWKPLFHIPPEDSLNTMLVAITGDGKSLLMQDSRGRNTTALVVRDLATGNENVLAEAAQSDISSVILDPQSRSILAYFSEYDQPRWTALSPETAPDIAYLSKLLPGAWMVLSQSADNRLWTLRIDNSDAPVSFALYDRKTK
ncbi:MAG TPA: S9 family peptidase, partial [Alphaproteobacteria bacterium]|nr:S9 family peptidase [Alphaproteobacteria bacterium]